jgi:cell division protein FtsB
MHIKVENDTLVRDMESNAILETDKAKLQRHRAIKRSIKSKADQLDQLHDKINKLEQLLERMTNGDNIQTN